MDATAQALAEAQAAQDAELLAALQARPRAQVDELKLRMESMVVQRPNRAQRRAMAKASRQGAKGRERALARTADRLALEALALSAGS